MNELEQALMLNTNIERQSQYLPTGETFEHVNREREFYQRQRIINAISRDQNKK